MGLCRGASGGVFGNAVKARRQVCQRGNGALTAGSVGERTAAALSGWGASVIER